MYFRGKTLNHGLNSTQLVNNVVQKANIEDIMYREKCYHLVFLVCSD